MILEKLTHPENAPVKEDLRCQRITWAIERLGWLVMAGIVGAALAGFFGGPATREEVSDGSGRVRVAYRHFQRHLDPTELRLTVDTWGQSVFEITVDRELEKAFEIRTVTPEPIETQAHDGGVLLKFASSAETDAPANITITGVPADIGRVKGAIGLLGQTPARLDIFIYP